MLTEDVFTHASIEQASSHRATIEAEHRACIEPASSLHRATASSQHRSFSIEHRGRGSVGDFVSSTLCVTCECECVLCVCLCLTLCDCVVCVSVQPTLYSDSVTQCVCESRSNYNNEFMTNPAAIAELGLVREGGAGS